MIIGPRTVVVRAPSLLSTPVDDEIVILNTGRDNYVGLNKVGRTVWELIDEPCEVAELCRKLSHDFDATPERIETDVVPFLTEIADEGIVRVVSP